MLEKGNYCLCTCSISIIKSVFSKKNRQNILIQVISFLQCQLPKKNVFLQLLKCGFCRSTMTNFNALFYERLLDIVKDDADVPCIFPVCGFSDYRSSIENHEALCFYRPIKCNNAIKGCLFEGNLFSFAGKKCKCHST